MPLRGVVKPFGRNMRSSAVTLVRISMAGAGERLAAVAESAGALAEDSGQAVGLNAGQRHGVNTTRTRLSDVDPQQLSGRYLAHTAAGAEQRVLEGSAA